jgi:hypothetical protein
MSDNDVEDQMYMLAKSPSSTIPTFQGYKINRNTFYTIAQDRKSTNQNSGTLFDAATDNGQNVTYYGYIEEIWELGYGRRYFTGWNFSFINVSLFLVVPPLCLTSHDGYSLLMDRLIGLGRLAQPNWKQLEASPTNTLHP